MKWEVGMKVKIPKTKSNGCLLENSYIERNKSEIKQDFLYITEICGGKSVVLYKDYPSGKGDYYSIEDLIPYSNQIELDFGEE